MSNKCYTRTKGEQNMVIYEQHVELSKSEKKQLRCITGVEPVNIKTVSQLEDFIKSHAPKLKYAGPGACMARRLLFSFMPPAYSKAS